MVVMVLIRLEGGDEEQEAFVPSVVVTIIGLVARESVPSVTVCTSAVDVFEIWTRFVDVAWLIMTRLLSAMVGDSVLVD